MDSFENFTDRALIADPADAGDAAERGRQAVRDTATMETSPAGTPSAMAATPKRERRATAHALPSMTPPDAHTSATAFEPERDRQAKPSLQPRLWSPADQSTALSAKLGRQAISPTPPIYGLPGGQPSDATASAARVGDDGGAHRVNDSQWDFSPAVVKCSDAAKGVHTTDLLAVLDGGEPARASQAALSSQSQLVAEITQLWRMRQRWHRAEKSLILQGKAICRAWTAGDKDAADKLFASAAKGESADPTVDMALMPFLSGIDRFQTERSAIEKRLRKLAQALPLWPWVSEVKGFGPLNLAAIVGEAGEISSYRNPSCLWKRMGLAVIDGGRQRRVADAAAALVHGYAPQRRCVAYLLGDTLIKAGDGCRYRPVYAARREHTVVTHPDWTKAHSHNDAARYMVKRVLRDLWAHARGQQVEA